MAEFRMIRRLFSRRTLHFKAYATPIILYFALSFALWFVVPPVGHYDLDSYGYDPMAHHFAQTGALVDPHSNSAPIQPVGYPFVLGILFWLCGHHLLSVIVFQVMLICCVMSMLIAIARSWFSDAVAWTVGLSAACNLGFLVYAQLLLAEVLLLFFLVLFLERYLSFVKTGNCAYLVAAAVALGCSIVVKPIALLVLLPLICITYHAHTSVSHIILLCAYFLMPIGLHMAHNYAHYGFFSFAPVAQLNLYQCLLAKVMSEVENIEEQQIIDTTLRFNGQQMLNEQEWSQAKSYFYHYLYYYPLHVACIWLINMTKTCFGLYSTQLKKMLHPEIHSQTHSFFHQQGSFVERFYYYIIGGTTSYAMMVVAWFELFYSMIRLLCAIIGLFVMRKMEQMQMLSVFISIIICCTLVTGIDGCCRYRLAYEPILLLLASVGWITLWSYYNQQNKGYNYEASW